VPLTLFGTARRTVMAAPVSSGNEPGPASDVGGGRDDGWRRDFILQLIITGVAVTAINATRPMITYRALGLDAGPLEIGLTQSAHSFLPALLAVALGRWVDRFGERRFLILAMVLIAVGATGASLAGSLVLLGIANAVMGLGQITNLVSAQALVANRGPRDKREERFGWFSTVASLGQLIGPAIGAGLVGSIGVAAAASTGPFADNPQAPVFVFAALAAVIAFVLAFRMPKRSTRAATAQAEAAEVGMATAAVQVLRRPGMTAAMFVSIAVISSVDVLVAYLPAYGEATGLSVETVGLLLSVRAGSSLVSRLFMARMIESLGRRPLLALSMVLAGGGIVLLPFVSSTPVLFALMIAIGLGLGLGQPMTIAWVANRSLRHERGLALGVRLTGNRVALLVVPSAMGALAGASGIAAIWLALAAFLATGAFVAARTPFDDLVKRPGRPPAPTEAPEPG
jgi:MFS family permease